MDIFYKRLKDDKNKIFGKSKDICELELESLIDKDKSGYCFIHPKYKFVEFKYDLAHEFLPKDHKLIYGEMKVKGSCIEIFSTIDERFNDAKNRVRLLVDKPISAKEYDFVNIVFERSFDDTFFIGFFDNFTRTLDLEFCGGNQNLPSYTSPECDIFYNNFDKDLLKMIRRVGLKYVRETLKTEKCLRENIDCLINISEGFIQINNGRRIYNELFLRPEETYITYGYHPGKKNEVVGKIKKVSMGKNQGYVYLKPVKVPYRKCNVLMCYSGKPVVEYYNENQSKWIKLDQTSSIELYSALNLRVAMNHRDRIYSMDIINLA